MTIILIRIGELLVSPEFPGVPENQHFPAQGPVLASLERDHCARLLEETYGALQGQGEEKMVGFWKVRIL